MEARAHLSQMVDEVGLPNSKVVSAWTAMAGVIGCER